MNISVLDLVRLSLDVAKGCRYLEENRFVHRWVQHTITFVIGQGMFFSVISSSRLHTYGK